MARRELSPAQISPKRRPLPPSHTEEEADILADELISLIKQAPRAGNPHRGYIVFLCKLYPEHLLRRALSTAKADYHGLVKKTLTHVFVYEVEILVKESKKLLWYKD